MRCAHCKIIEHIGDIAGQGKQQAPGPAIIAGTGAQDPLSSLRPSIIPEAARRNLSSSTSCWSLLCVGLGLEEVFV